MRVELVRMELEEENQVIKWRGGHQKGLGWLWEPLDVVGGIYSKAWFGWSILYTVLLFPRPQYFPIR